MNGFVFYFTLFLEIVYMDIVSVKAFVIKVNHLST